MRSRVVFAFVLLAALGSVGAQSPEINNDLVKMIQGGLPESVVIQKIQESLGHWDTSTDALISLKKVGATEAELNAILRQPTHQTNAEPTHAMSVKFLGGEIQRTPTNGTVLMFPTTTRMTFPDGRLSGSAYLVKYDGEPGFLIPATRLYRGGCMLENVIFLKEKLVFDWYMSDTCSDRPGISIASTKQTELLTEPRQGLTLEVDKTYTKMGMLGYSSVNGQTFYTLDIPHQKLVREIENSKKKAMSDDVIFGIFLPHNYDKMEQPAMRAAMLDPFLLRLMNNFDSTLADFLRAAQSPSVAGLPDSGETYSRVTPEKGGEYVAVLSQAYQEAKHRGGGGGLASFVNTMQGISNMQAAMEQGRAADAAHNGAAQISAATNIVSAELQTLNSVSNPNAAPIAPLNSQGQQMPGSNTLSMPGSLASVATSSSAGLYVGPNSVWVHRLLSTAGPYTCSPNGKVKTPTKFSCQRDAEISKAQLLAWGAECSEQTGYHEDAVKSADVMMQTLSTAKALCGAQSQRITCDSDRVISCSQLP